jgi:hypothetical protein
LVARGREMDAPPMPAGAPPQVGAGVDLEPGAPPPLTLPEEPQVAPPPGHAEAGSFEAEAASWFDQKFTLTLFGKRLSSETARMLLLGSGATIIVLIVVIFASSSPPPPPPPPPLPLPPSLARPPPPSRTVPGCTEPNAQNFDPTSTTNDGSCRYPPAPP